jgi:hypothetical protein
MGAKYTQVYWGDVIEVTGLMACCDCGLVHRYQILPRKKGRPSRMRVTAEKRSTAMFRRHRAATLRKKLRSVGLAR